MQYINAYWEDDTLITYYRDNDKLFSKQESAEHSFFLKKSDTNEKLKFLRKEPKCIAIKVEGDWVRVKWKFERTSDWIPYHVQVAKDIETNLGIQTYEADVSPTRRFLVENGGEIGRPRRCYLDIETDSRVPFSRKFDARILCWVVIGEGDGSAIDAAILSDEDDESEAKLLEALWNTLDKYDQVVSWNGDRFDFPMIKERSKRLELEVQTKRWLWLDHLVLFQKMNVSAESGEEKQSMALDAVSKSVLGEGKTEGVSGAMSYQMWAGEFGGRGKLLDYCAQDTDLMRKIEAKTGYIELLQTIAEATKVFPDTWGINSSGQVESFLMQLAKKKNLKFKTHFKTVTSEKFDGAYVMEPTTKGIIQNVHVADFASLYPSIILTWNMSPETYQGGQNVGENDNICVAPRTEIGFLNEPRGILPEAVEELIRLRKYWNDKKSSLPPGTDEWKDADRRSTGYKITANAFYGVIGLVHSRFYIRDLAESVAQSGVWLIKNTIDAAKVRGYDVIYGDTDSIFVVGPSKDEFEDFTKWCNVDLYPRLLKGRNCSRNNIKLAYEKAFDRIVFVSAKKYVGKYSHYKGTMATADSRPEIKGLEYKRGDVSRLTRALQSEVISMILAGTSLPDPKIFDDLLNRWKERILVEELDKKEITISKKLGKPLNDYVRRTKQDGALMAEPVHIDVARRLAARGLDVGEGVKIDYIVTDASSNHIKAIPACDFDGEYDRYYLWEHLVYPPTERLLVAAFPNVDWYTWENVRPKKENPNQLSFGLESLGEVIQTK